MKRLNSIQILRFLAASGVVLAHCASGYFFIGIAGVDVFFVVSGFIIASVMPGRSVGEFLFDRVTRIYPIYWLFTVVMVALWWDGDWLRLASSMTLWPVFGQFRVPYLAVGWTLYFEMLFYVCAALVVWRRWMLGPLLVAYALAFWSGFGFLGSPMVLEFLFGVGIALSPRTEFRWTGAALIGLSIGSMVFFADPAFGLIESQFNGAAGSRPFVWGIPAALIVWGALQWEKKLGKSWLSKGGDASYSIYLSHPLTLGLVSWNPYVKLFSAPLLVLAGVACHHLVEKPLLNAARRLRQSRPDRPFLDRTGSAVTDEVDRDTMSYQKPPHQDR